jgi:hypothetical protein
MSHKSTNTLMNLSKETKILVNQGTFSLFSITPETGSKGEFLLCAQSENFILDNTGAVVTTLDDIKSVNIVSSIKFPDIQERIYSLGKVNFA